MYMSAALQMLCHTPDVAQYFLTEEYKNDKIDFNFSSWPVSDQISSLIKNIWSGSQKSFSPEKFKSEANKYIDILNDFNQKDSCELFLKLINCMHEELTG